MPLGIDFCLDVGGFGFPKWSLVGTIMGSKIVVCLEGRFFKIRAPAAARAGPRGYPIGRSDGVPPSFSIFIGFQSLLGAIWSPLGPIWSAFGPTWFHFGPIWSPLGPI